MPILVRPVREQLEHDRIIRLLQAKYRRKHEVAVNVGTEQTAAVENGTAHLYPDVVLYSQDRGHKLQGTIEVETGESVNSLEAMAQWGPFSRLRAPFYLYIPPASIDTVRRLCADHHIPVAEIWTYHVVADQVRFTMVHRSQEAIDAAEKAAAEKPAAKVAAEKAPARAVKAEEPARAKAPAAAKAATKPAPKAQKSAARPVKTAKAAKATRPAAKPGRNGKAAPVKASEKKAAPARPAARAAKAKPAARKR